jgi:hypothetical protein
MLRGTGVTVVLCLAGLAWAQQTAPPPMTLGDRARFYATNTFGPSALGTSALWAGVDLWRDVPEGWDQGAGGYFRRFGSSIGVNAGSNAIAFAVGALDGEDVRYRRAPEMPFWQRARHVVVTTYWVRKNGRSGHMFAFSRISGAYAGAFLGNQWYPPGDDGTREAIIRGSWSLLSDLGTSAFREFWPDVKRRLFKRRKPDDSQLGSHP